MTALPLFLCIADILEHSDTFQMVPKAVTLAPEPANRG